MLGIRLQCSMSGLQHSTPIFHVSVRHSALGFNTDSRFQCLICCLQVSNPIIDFNCSMIHSEFQGLNFQCLFRISMFDVRFGISDFRCLSITLRIALFGSRSSIDDDNAECGGDIEDTPAEGDLCTTGAPICVCPPVEGRSSHKNV